MEKLIKDCKVGDLLYYVSDPDFHENRDDEIFQVKITEIKRGGEFEGGDTFKCERSETVYTFKHQNSDFHDSLIVDTDYACYTKDGYCEGRFYTTYQAAVDFLINGLQYKLLHDLERLDDAELKFGLAKYNAFQKITNEITVDYEKYKKTEIYDLTSFSDKTPTWVNRQLKNKKVKVYKRLVETDAYGSVRWSGTDIFVKEFDSIEEANRFMKENDKSYYHGESDFWYEGDRYFIKED